MQSALRSCGELQGMLRDRNDKKSGVGLKPTPRVRSNGG
jgi:hypothetical protein